MARFIRRLVSKHNQRYTENGIDLDLTYITPRWIAMGFPGQGFQSNYRNPASSVAEFLDSRHPGHFKVFNLSEQSYVPSIFKGPVAHFPFPDHHAPSFSLLIQMMKEMHEWLLRDPENVIAVHCLAGHGRTGVIICALFLFEDVFSLPDEAMREFAAMRSKAGKGIKYPSQRRYIFYSAEHIAMCRERNLDKFQLLPEPARILELIEFRHLWVKLKTCRYMLVVLNAHYDIIYNSAWFQTPETVSEQNISFRPNLLLTGDFTIKLYRTGHHNLIRKMKEVVRISLDTIFLLKLGIPFPKGDLDGPSSDTENVKYPEDLTALVQFAIPETANG
jgi:hypothetical protein